MKIAHWAAIPAAGLLLVLAACGSGGGSGSGTATATASPPAATTLAKQARAAVQAAKSVHIAGTLKESGRTLGVDLSLTRSAGLAGRLSVNGASFYVLSTHGSAYIKVTSAFLRLAKLPSAACSLVCGKYLKVPTSEAGSLTGGLSMADVLGTAGAATGHVQYAGTATVHGQHAWVLRGADGSKVYVAQLSPHYPLRVIAPPGKTGQLDFTQWNSVTIPPPPPASQVVDPSQLHG